MKTEFLKELRRNSPFTKNSYEVNVPLKNFIKAIYGYNTAADDEPEDFLKVVENATPAFQRDAGKWTRQMQIKFVENLFLGYTSVVMLGCIVANEKDSGSFDNAQIIDGLQRTTAIAKFLSGEFPIFADKIEGGFWACDIKTATNPHNLKIRIYEFKDEREMIQFYIDMNENITHSPEDIAKARSFLPL